VIRDRKLRTEDGTVVSEGSGALAREDLELNKVLEDIGNLTEDQREVMNNASTFTDGTTVINHTDSEFTGKCPTCGQPYLGRELEQLRFTIRHTQAEVTMLQERLTRWAKVITEMYKQVTQEILF